MNRWRIKPDALEFAEFHSHGEWVKYADAMADREAYAEEKAREAVARARDEIVYALERQRGLEHPEESGISDAVRHARTGRKMGLTLAIERIRSRGETKPDLHSTGVWDIDKYNALVDTVNLLSEKYDSLIHIWRNR